jgi:hypothetical protein
MRPVRMPSGRAFIGARLRRALLVGVGVAAISLATAPGALANVSRTCSAGTCTTTIDTTTGTPHWNGSSSVSGFGYPNTATFGQTVTVPATDTKLDSFTFYMKLPIGLLFRGEVYAWDNTAHHATGTALYESGATHTTNASVFQSIPFNTGGINLTAGAHYVLFATISKDYAADAMPPPHGAGKGSWGLIPLSGPPPAESGDAYSGGDFNYINNGSDTSRWTTPTWNEFGSNAPLDLAFKASFSSPDHDLALAQPSDLTGVNAVNATSPAGAVVTYTNPAATDESLATVTVNCVPASGSPFATGDTTVTCTATDTDGDTNSPVQKSFNVHVKGAAEQLSDLANAVTGVGPGTSLADKVAAVQSDLAANDTGDACGTLNAFINEVNAQTPKHIKADQAANLIEAAQLIEAVIPCTS